MSYFIILLSRKQNKNVLLKLIQLEGNTCINTNKFIPTKVRYTYKVKYTNTVHYPLYYNIIQISLL